MFKAILEINDLPFAVRSSSRYICKKCMDTLKRRNCIRLKIKELDRELLETHRQACFRQNICLKIKFGGSSQEEGDISMHPTKIIAAESEARDVSSQADNIIYSSERNAANDHDARDCTTEVYIRVNWKSQTRERKLPPFLQTLGKKLLSGTFKQIL